MEHSKRLKPEVLAPAGNLDILKIAIILVVKLTGSEPLPTILQMKKS